MKEKRKKATDITSQPRDFLKEDKEELKKQKKREEALFDELMEQDCCSQNKSLSLSPKSGKQRDLSTERREMTLVKNASLQSVKTITQEDNIAAVDQMDPKFSSWNRDPSSAISSLRQQRHSLQQNYPVADTIQIKRSNKNLHM